jgi:hypothetical protein
MASWMTFRQRIHWFNAEANVFGGNVTRNHDPIALGQTKVKDCIRQGGIAAISGFGTQHKSIRAKPTSEVIATKIAN